jgi:formylglycine-generating enzyme required for sulfatase activity
MGSASQELGRDNDESQHEVNLLQPFVILSTEVTQFNYKRVMGYNPAAATNCGDDCPVEQISWHEAAQFCNALSARDSLPACYTCSGSTAATSSCTRAADFATPYDCPGYRLPTEAEWEYAARADTVTASYRADLDAEHLSCEQQNPALEDIAWFCGSSGGQPHQVATRQANAWQLYDMLGNVWEWCDDAYAPYPAATSVENPYTNQGQRQLMRGGDFGAEAHLVRAAQRASEIAAARHANLGFRPVRSLLP